MSFWLTNCHLPIEAFPKAPNVRSNPRETSKKLKRVGEVPAATSAINLTTNVRNKPSFRGAAVVSPGLLLKESVVVIRIPRRFWLICSLSVPVVCRPK